MDLKYFSRKIIKDKGGGSTSIFYLTKNKEMSRANKQSQKPF
jgi:hypothetical protein